MTCIIPREESKDVTFGEVLHVPDLQKYLISVQSITKNGGSVHFSGGKCEISTQEGLVAVGHKEKKNMLWIVKKIVFLLLLLEQIPQEDNYWNFCIYV